MTARRSSIRSRLISQVLEGRKHEPVSLFTVRRSIAFEGFLPRIFRGSVALCVSILLFATFGASVVLLPSPFFRPFSSGCSSHHNSAAAVAKSFRPSPISTAAGMRKFRDRAGDKFSRTLIDVSAASGLKKNSENLREIGCDFLLSARSRSDFRLYENPPCSRLCVLLTGT